MPWGFAPSRASAEALDAARHDDLGDSLAHLAEAFGATPGWGAPARDARAAADAVRAGRRVPPAAFAQYFDLGEAGLGGDLARATEAAAALAAAAPRGPGRPVRARGRAGALDALLERRMGDEAAQFAPIDAATAERFAARLDEGLALLRAGAPDLHGEVDVLVREVLVARAPAGAAMEFDGASHYQFWGLLILNPDHHPDRLAMAEVLAHEAGHSLLFGLTRDEPLTTNPTEARYASPLRRDPRPMEGIFHATFVSARMAWAMDRLSRADACTAEERARARELAAHDARNFAAGRAVIAEHGALTPSAAAVLAEVDAAVAALDATAGAG